ncbi:MAG TPA: potassium-transporting ATPase subunit C, partial [Acidimicrobiales bacterium]
MRRQLLAALMMVVVFTLVTGLAYPLAVTAVAQGLFHRQAEGSLVEDADGNVVGSSLIGQTSTEPRYFHPRPSAAGDGYDPTASSGSNLGPTNEVLLSLVA